MKDGFVQMSLKVAQGGRLTWWSKQFRYAVDNELLAKAKQNKTSQSRVLASKGHVKISRTESCESVSWSTKGSGKPLRNEFVRFFSSHIT